MSLLPPSSAPAGPPWSRRTTSDAAFAPAGAGPDGTAPGVEMEVALDLGRRALWLTPILVAAFGAIWGINGALSTLYAIALVVANFLLAAVLLTTTARISVGLMMGAALFGYLARLGLIFAAVWLVSDAAWVEIVPLCLAIIITHLGLLFWEMRHISATLAHPGLKPTTKGS